MDIETKGAYTPLHVASHYGQANMTRFLLDNDASVKAQTTHGWVLFIQTEKNNNFEIDTYSFYCWCTVIDIATMKSLIIIISQQSTPQYSFFGVPYPTTTCLRSSVQLMRKSDLLNVCHGLRVSLIDYELLLL